MTYDTAPHYAHVCELLRAHVSDRFARVFSDARAAGYTRVSNCSANAGIAEVAKERAQNA